MSIEDLIKIPKSFVGYADIGGPGPIICAQCIYFRQPDSCEEVFGRIDPGGWCREYERKTNDHE